MGHIFAIGGGEIRLNETLEIDKLIVEASGKTNPKLLFIPTASGEPQGYVDSVKNIFSDKLGCKVKTLYLLQDKTTIEEARALILDSDIIYVGGGNTQYMLRIWKKYRVNEALIEAYYSGIILSGLSAGSICWFENGHSDSEKIADKEGWNYIRIQGLGLIKALHCPHYNEDERKKDFDRMLLDTDDIGIALENNCAIEINDEKYRIIKCKESANAYKIYSIKGKLIKEELVKQEYSQMNSLLTK